MKKLTSVRVPEAFLVPQNTELVNFSEFSFNAKIYMVTQCACVKVKYSVHKSNCSVKEFDHNPKGITRLKNDT